MPDHYCLQYDSEECLAWQRPDIETHPQWHAKVAWHQMCLCKHGVSTVRCPKQHAVKLNEENLVEYAYEAPDIRQRAFGLTAGFQGYPLSRLQDVPWQHLHLHSCLFRAFALLLFATSKK